MNVPEHWRDHPVQYAVALADIPSSGLTADLAAIVKEWAPIVATVYAEIDGYRRAKNRVAGLADSAEISRYDARRADLGEDAISIMDALLEATQ